MLANCGLDQGRKVVSVRGNYYILQNSWFGSMAGMQETWTVGQHMMDASIVQLDFDEMVNV